MEVDAKNSLILGRPFLSTANANIDVGTGTIQLRFNGETEQFAFRPKESQTQQVHMVSEVKPKQKDRPPSYQELVKMVEALTLRLEKKNHDRYHARRRISRKETLKKLDAQIDDQSRRTRKVWREKVPSESSEDRQAQDGKSEPSP